MSKASQSLVSPRTLALLTALAAEVALATSASAQFTSAIDFSSRTGQPNTGPWASQLAVSPFARFDNSRFTLDGRWTAVGGDGQRLNGYRQLGRYVLLAKPRRPSALGRGIRRSCAAQRSLRGFENRDGRSPLVSNRECWRMARPRGLARQQVDADLASAPFLSRHVETVGQRSSFALHSHHSDRSRVRGPPARIRRKRLSPADTLVTTTVFDSASSGTRRDWSDAELGLHWSGGRLAFQALVGTRFSVTNQPNETWGQVQGSLALARDIALIAVTGVQPSSTVYGLPRARFVELGFRVAPSALLHPRLPGVVRPSVAAFQVDAAENGRRTLRIRIPDARSVELSGDFTSWKPVALKRSDSDAWETTLPIAPGMHRLAIRVNGDAWTPPPGTTAVPDEFQGTVGVIVIK